MNGTYIAFDYGEKRIGTAVGEASIGTAQPTTIVANHSGTPDWAIIEALINRWEPVGLVVGVPLTENGENQQMTFAARGFIKSCRKRFQLPVFEAEERFSSNAASSEIRHMRASGQRNRKTAPADIDTLSAALILESWFESTSDLQHDND
jgi:putative Holliday junction resolvase